MSKSKNSGLDQYGAEPFEQQQFGTAGVEGVKKLNGLIMCTSSLLSKLIHSNSLMKFIPRLCVIRLLRRSMKY